MWIFKVKRPPGSPLTFKAQYVARGFSQREGVNFFQTFSPTPKRTTLRVLLHVAAQRDYELHSPDFSTAFLQGTLHEAIWLRRPQGFTVKLIYSLHCVGCSGVAHKGYNPIRAPGPLDPATATAATATATAATAAATAAPACCTTMASLRVLAFDHEGRPVQFDTWLDDLQLYPLSDSKDSVSLFDLASGTAPAPPTTDDSATRSQWLTRDAAAHLAIRNHLPFAECAHFGEHRTAQALYDAVVSRYSSTATAALGRLLLPYLFHELSAFAMVEDLVSHLRTSDTRYRATVPAEDQFLSLDPTSLTVDLLEQHLLAAETSAVAVGVARGTPRPPFFEGCSPSPLVPSYASTVATDVPGAEDVGAASASAKCRSSKGKGSRGGGGGSGRGGGGSSGGSGGSRGGGSCGSGGGSGGVGGGGGGSGGSGGSGGGGTGGGRTGAWHGGSRGGQQQHQQRRSETQSPQQLRDRAGQTCGRLHTQHRCFSRLDDAWRAEFGDEVELPRWADLLRSGVAIFDLDFDAIISAMYALSVSAEGDCYRCVRPNPGIAAAALGASESVLPGTVPAEALHTFTLDSGASCCFFRDSTTLTPLPAPVEIRLADPSGGPFVARSSTVFPCPAVPSGSLSGLHLPSFSTNLVSTAALQDAMVTATTPGDQRVSICTCTRIGRHLATFTRQPGSSLYTLATEPPQVAGSAQVSASGQVPPPCSCHLLSHQTLLWRYRLGHPSCHAFVACTPISLSLVFTGLCLPSLPRLPRPAYLALRGGSVPLLTPPRFPRRLLPCRLSTWTCGAQLMSLDRAMSATFCWSLTTTHVRAFVLRLHSDRGGEFSSNLLRDFCCGEGILQSFTLPDSPQKNGIAERRIGLVMEVARTSMIHVAAPHFLWPFCVFRVRGSCAFVRDTFADKLSTRAIPCVFLGFVPDTPGWQFYHPASRHVLPSQDITFDESVPFYSLFPYRSAPLPPPPLFLAPGPPRIDPLPPQSPAPSGVSQVDPPHGAVPGEVAVDSGAARGTTYGSAEHGGAEPGGAEPGGAATGGAEPGGAEPGGAEIGGAEPWGAKTEGVEPGGAESEGAESGGVEPQGAASYRGSAGASPRLSPQHLRKWLVRRARLRSGATGATGAGVVGAGGAGVPARAGVTGCTATTGPGGACTRGTGDAGTGGVGGAGAGDPTESGADGAGGTVTGGAGAGGARVGGAGVGGAGAGGAGARGAGAVHPGDAVRPRPYFVPLLQQILGVLSSTVLTPPLLCPPPDQLQLPLQPASPLPAPSPYTEQSGGLTEHREPASRPVLPVRTARCVPHSRPPLVLGTHAMALRPSSVPLRVPLPVPPESSLPEVPGPRSDRARAASPTVSRLLATAVTDPSFETAAASALVAELLDFAAA
ncbi:unnamed protein product [Closterium sp. NIES-54]